LDARQGMQEKTRTREHSQESSRKKRGMEKSWLCPKDWRLSGSDGVGFVGVDAEVFDGVLDGGFADQAILG
jgi:hypothetical protein